MQLITPRQCGEATVNGVKSSVIKQPRIDHDQRLITCTANTSTIDMDEEVVVPEGAPAIGKAYWDTAKSVYLDHVYASERVVGKMRSRKLVNGEWLCQLYMSKATRLARDVFELIAEGAIGGVSIGFEATNRSEPTDDEVEKYGLCSVITRAWNWIELSVTAMPCNPAAQIALMEGGRAELEDGKAALIDGLVSKNRISRDTAVLIGLPDRKVYAVTTPKVMDLGRRVMTLN